jgi:hypothetical protein
MYEWGLRGYADALGHEQVQLYRPALNTLESLGDLYIEQAETNKAQKIHVPALSGLSCVPDQLSGKCKVLAANIDALPVLRTEGKQDPSLQAVRERSKMVHNGHEKSTRLSIQNLVRWVF